MTFLITISCVTITKTVLASTLGSVFLGLRAAAVRVTELVTGHALVLVYTCFPNSAVSIEHIVTPAGLGLL